MRAARRRKLYSLRKPSGCNADTVAQDFADSGATTWALAVTVNKTLKSTAFGITGEASKSTKWVSEVRTGKVVGWCSLIWG